MRRRIIILLILLLLVVCLTLTKCQQRCSHPSAEDEVEGFVPTSLNMILSNEMSDFSGTKTFDKSIESFMRRWELKGASFAIMRNDSLLYAKGYGLANDTLPMDAGHVLRIASASKLLTATAIMRLVEQQRLSLESQVFGRDGILHDTIFLDLHGRNQEKITVEHLLRHTSGFSSPYGDPAFANYGIATFLGKELPLSLDDMVVYATRNRIRYRPGGTYRYSNLGYIVLTKIVEQVTSQSYESYIQDSILAPIGCYNMFIGHSFSENRAPNEASYFEVKEAEEVEAYDGSDRVTMKSNGGNNIQLLSGAGGWVASPSELLRFVAAINGEGSKEDILTPQSIETMTGGKNSGRPIGWASIHQSEWRRSGSMAGTSALIKKQSNGYTWIFISNSSAWIGPHISKYISTHVTRAVNKVKEWPERDLFTLQEAE